MEDAAYCNGCGKRVCQDSGCGDCGSGSWVPWAASIGFHKKPCASLETAPAALVEVGLKKLIGHDLLGYFFMDSWHLQCVSKSIQAICQGETRTLAVRNHNNGPLTTRRLRFIVQSFSSMTTLQSLTLPKANTFGWSAYWPLTAITQLKHLRLNVQSQDILGHFNREQLQKYLDLNSRQAYNLTSHARRLFGCIQQELKARQTHAPHREQHNLMTLLIALQQRPLLSLCLNNLCLNHYVRTDMIQRTSSSFGMDGSELLVLMRKEIKVLSLRSGGLSGRIPSFASFPSLEKISLNSNSLREQIPSFDMCRHLVELDLAHNSLTGEIPSFRLCTLLRKLMLQHNELCGEYEKFPS
jgi:hypothetical protein